MRSLPAAQMQSAHFCCSSHSFQKTACLHFLCSTSRLPLTLPDEDLVQLNLTCCPEPKMAVWCVTPASCASWSGSSKTRAFRSCLGSWCRTPYSNSQRHDRMLSWDSETSLGPRYPRFAKRRFCHQPLPLCWQSLRQLLAWSGRRIDLSKRNESVNFFQPLTLQWPPAWYVFSSVVLACCQ